MMKMFKRDVGNEEATLKLLFYYYKIKKMLNTKSKFDCKCSI